MNQSEGTDISSLFPSNSYPLNLPSYPRQWRADWKQPASAMVSPALVLYGLAGSSCLLFTTLGACWSIDTTLLCECWASPTQPPGRPNSQAPVAKVRASGLPTWSTWKTPPASAGPLATPLVQVAVRAPKTQAVRVCAADVVITQPCASPACLATARYAGAATWSVRHVWERRRYIPAKMHSCMMR